ncbi:sensor histidine kinase [Lentzea aerocolonigenes]|uniref:sensor histidine kinase n=1 Tax=Lentzea aerocolonigenes TaxID=68170 RepID=UPI0018C897FB|nr:histidine kinase [Lentzea aerocolonigenes]
MAELVVLAIDLALLLALQLTYFRELGTTARNVTLAAQVLLLLAPLVLGHAWAAAAGLVAGNALLVLPPWAGWPTFAATVLVTGLSNGASPGEAAVAAAATGLLLAYLGTPRPVPDAPDTPDAPDLPVAASKIHTAVAAERMRVARDLHDLLGYSLSAIKLKSELAHRIVGEQPETAKQQLSEILDITHHALADVRSLARAYRPLSLADTSDSAKAMLAASNIDVRVELDHDPLPEPVESVLAAVLCEAVTNVLRHSDASSCTIGVRQRGSTVLLDVINDGARARPASADCNGVRNQAERVQAAGGTFSARLVDDGTFHVHATIPAPSPRS